jgi:hypothetical protein
MTQTTPVPPTDPGTWTEEQALELWKYFGGVGAADKNTMVTVETLLLTLSSTALGYLVTEIFCFNPFSVTRPYQGLGVAMLGFGVSCVAAGLAVLYGGYSNWNWAMADLIARKQKEAIEARRPRDQPKRPIKWETLLPEAAKTSITVKTDRTVWFPSYHKKAMKWGQPCDPTERLAPIFPVFTTVARVAALLHAGVAIVSVYFLPWWR